MTIWVRVRSVRTRHHFDVALETLDRLLTKGAVEEIPGRRHTGQPRPPKYNRPLGTRVGKARPRPADNRRNA